MASVSGVAPARNYGSGRNSLIARTRFERLVTRAFERQRTMEDGWRTFSEAYLINPERIKRKQIARQRFAASIRRVIFLRLSVREIITYLGLNTQFGAWWPPGMWLRFLGDVLPD